MLWNLASKVERPSNISTWFAIERPLRNPLVLIHNTAGRGGQGPVNGGRDDFVVRVAEGYGPGLGRGPARAAVDVLKGLLTLRDADQVSVVEFVGD